MKRKEATTPPHGCGTRQLLTLPVPYWPTLHHRRPHCFVNVLRDPSARTGRTVSLSGLDSGGDPFPWGPAPQRCSDRLSAPHSLVSPQMTASEGDQDPRRVRPAWLPQCEEPSRASPGLPAARTGITPGSRLRTSPSSGPLQEVTASDTRTLPRQGTDSQELSSGVSWPALDPPGTAFADPAPQTLLLVLRALERAQRGRRGVMPPRRRPCLLQATCRPCHSAAP